MNKAELIAKLAEDCELSQKDAKGVVEALFGTEPRQGIIANQLEAGNKVQITGFGTFEVRGRKARTGRNPRTGESIEIAASKVPVFSAGKALKDRYSA